MTRPFFAAASFIVTLAAAQSEFKPIVDPAKAGIGTYDIREFGAVGDGQATNTSAIQAAIDACTTNGGGTVLVSGGDFLTGTVELKNNVRLYLAPTAHIQGVAGIENYRRGTGLSRGNGNYVLLYAADAKNVTIEGRGTIDGDALQLRSFSRSKERKGKTSRWTEAISRRPAGR